MQINQEAHLRMYQVHKYIILHFIVCCTYIRVKQISRYKIQIFYFSYISSKLILISIRFKFPKFGSWCQLMNKQKGVHSCIQIPSGMLFTVYFHATFLIQ